MIDLICFDLDGVLVDACEMHRVALNEALIELNYPPISIEDHINKYNGLPTKTKLRLIGYNEHTVDLINKTKQDKTISTIRSTLSHDYDKEALFLSIKKYARSAQIACVTNSIRATAKEMLDRTGILGWFHILISNEDIVNPKPSPEGYLKAMSIADVSPSNTLIVEDSDYGYKAAIASGAKTIIRVKDPTELTSNKIIPCLL